MCQNFSDKLIIFIYFMIFDNDSKFENINLNQLQNLKRHIKNLKNTIQYQESDDIYSCKEAIDYLKSIRSTFENKKYLLRFLINLLSNLIDDENLFIKEVKTHKIYFKNKDKVRKIQNLNYIKKDKSSSDLSFSDKFKFFENYKETDNEVKNKIDIKRSYDYKAIREYYDFNNIIIKPYPYY